ncbi:MAG: molybdopterin-synthase adenylyltransferase MoeB, partial [Chloroflexi bacterium]|nr:molybdopterin-synthase adenylyltransferase MoeB [Chloroflexota bacterium]
MTTSLFSPEELTRYSRHIMLPQVGQQGQVRLKQASVIIVGTGGLGSPVSMYLAAAGIGRLGLVDFDTVDVSNLQRQIVHSESTLGMRKVDSAEMRLRGINPHITLETHHVPLNRTNALDILRSYDLIVDGTDNFPSRYLLNDAAVMLGKPLVYGSIYRFEGQVSVFGLKDGPCYRCLLPVPPPPHLVPSCAEAGVFGILPGTIGTIQATEVIKLLLGIGEPLVGRLLLYDALDLSFEMIKLPKRANCPVCGPHPTITQLIDYEEFCGMPGHDHSQDDQASRQNQLQPTDEPLYNDQSAHEINARLAAGEPLVLLDIREPYELEINHLNGARHIPLSQMAQRLAEIPR